VPDFVYNCILILVALCEVSKIVVCLAMSVYFMWKYRKQKEINDNIIMAFEKPVLCCHCQLLFSDVYVL